MRAKIIKGDPADLAIDMFDNIYRRNGRINFLKLKRACPEHVICECGTVYLKEGEVLECTECGRQFDSNSSAGKAFRT